MTENVRRDLFKEAKPMKKWVCPVCGYVHEGDTPPEKCPVCKVPGERFTLQAEELTWAAEHVLGIGKVFGEDVPENVKEEIIVEKTGNDLEIGFNSKFVLDVLKVIDDEQISLNFKSGVSPCVVKPVEGDSYEYLILPVRIPSM